MKNIKPSKNKKAFTLIESMVVLFIIGLLSAVAGIGYGIANRSKKIEQAGRKITSELDATRDYAEFGQEVDGKFPCGYGVALSKGQRLVQGVYTKGTVNVNGTDVELSREGAMEEDLTCDELIDSARNSNQGIGLAVIPTNGSDDLSFSSVTIENLNHVENNVSGGSLGCVVVLFSVPRSAPYYYSDSSPNCPLENGSAKFNLFTENISGAGPKDSNYFLTTLNISEGLSSSTGRHKTLPSGNGELVQE